MRPDLDCENEEGLFLLLAFKGHIGWASKKVVKKAKVSLISGSQV